MQWIDGHLDLAYLAVNGRDVHADCPDTAKGCVSFPAIRAANIEIIFGTIFTEPGVFGPAHPHGYPASDDADAAEAVGFRQLETYEHWQTDGELSIVGSAADLSRNGPAPKVIILMEGADPIRSPDHVGRWFQRGVRIVGMTWAAGTRYAGGNTNGGPLTSMGVELISAMDSAGMIHDASHLSDQAFDGLMANAKGPIIASHSNCRALLEPKQRHLRDDQIKAIGERGGVIGLNLYSAFLAKGRRATIADCVAHLQHVSEVMGHRHSVALGSDMDGGFGTDALPEGLEHPSKLPALANALSAEGWSEQEIAGFAGGNWRRFLMRALPQ